MHIQEEILAELNTADRLRESLDIIDIVIAFLSSSKMKADKPLKDYIDKVLKMGKKPFSQKVRHSHKLIVHHNYSFLITY